MELEKYIKCFNGHIQTRTLSSLLKFLNNKASFKQMGLVDESAPDNNSVDTKIRNTQGYDFLDNSYTGIHWKNFLKNVIDSYHGYYEKEHTTHAKHMASLEALKYEKGGMYVVHSDHCGSVPRTISVVLFLNNDYEGGELNFHDPIDNKKIYTTIKPKPGRCVMWPSNFLFPHSVSPVTKGTRYTIVSWLT